MRRHAAARGLGAVRSAARTRSPARAASSARACGDAAGSALVESLVALVLVALAGAMVASAARSGLRAAARAAVLTRTSALGGRELARIASSAATATSDETTFGVTGFADPVTCLTNVSRAGDVATLSVEIAAGRPAERVALSTRRWLAPPAGR